MKSGQIPKAPTASKPPKIVTSTTYTHPVTGEVYTTGKRGAKPNWVNDMIAGKTPSMPKSSGKVLAIEIPKAEEPTATMKVWKYVGHNKEDKTLRAQARCIIVAPTIEQAAIVASFTFKPHSAISGSEMAALWREVTDTDEIKALEESGICMKTANIWHTPNNKWEPRKKITQ
jgi:hypothetical protein